MLWDADGNSPLATAPWVDIRLSRSPGVVEIGLACDHMARVLELKENALKLHNAAAVTETRNRQLNQIGTALMSERNLDNLLNLILESHGPDRQRRRCLYLVEAQGPESRRSRPSTGATSRSASSSPATVRWNSDSRRWSCLRPAPPSWKQPAAGQAAQHPDVYEIPLKAYIGTTASSTSPWVRTRSMLTLPMKEHHNQVIGAIQLINKCRARHGPITSMASADAQVVPYRQDDVNMSLSLASQASVALLNAQYQRGHQEAVRGLHQRQRDRHRIAGSQHLGPLATGWPSLSVRMADALVRQRWAVPGLELHRAQLRELRYAALLHDFGKIGVREHVLVKAKKLFPRNWTA